MPTLRPRDPALFPKLWDGSKISFRGWCLKVSLLSMVGEFPFTLHFAQGGRGIAQHLGNAVLGFA